MTRRIDRILITALLAVCAITFLSADAAARPEYFSMNCAGCHFNDTATCNGCHAHGTRGSLGGAINLRATTDLTSYNPGQTVTVTFSGGHRQGWIRAILYDHNGVEVKRITGPTGQGDDGTGTLTQQFPVTLSAPAPTTPGSYRWTAAWFGSPYDITNRSTFPHVEERVQTNQFSVVAACADADGDGYQSSACNPDPLAGGGDCRDDLPFVNPGMTEIPYNGFNDDCNTATFDNDLDRDGYRLAEDCNDNNPAVNPGMTEVPYNGVDDDCNPATKDDDLDGDGFGRANDCNDNNAAVNPGVAEICGDGIDNDCDGLVDTSDPDCEVTPADNDGDGFAADVDCDDNNPAVNPGMTEVPYNGVDDDCNPATKDDDLDGDGFGQANDCNDNNAQVNPGKTEVPYNGVDDDCNPATKDDDLDGDGFGQANDCDDNNASVNPGAAEVCDDGIDNDCDGLVDTSDPDCEVTPIDNDGDGFAADVDCDDNNPAVNPGMTEVPYNGVDDDCNPATKDDDLDGDGFGRANDCNDNNAAVNPGVAEICGDGIDNDCDGLVDTSDPDCEVKPVDNDGDGFAADVDCDDNNPAVNPGVAEICGDGIDNDCDGLVDSSDPDCPTSTGVDGRILLMRASYEVEVEDDEPAMAQVTVFLGASGHGGRASGTLHLYKNGTLVGSMPVSLSSSGWASRTVKRVNVPVTAADAPYCTWEAHLELPGDPNLSNNSATKTTRVEVEDEDDDEHEDDEHEYRREYESREDRHDDEEDD